MRRNNAAAALSRMQNELPSRIDAASDVLPRSAITGFSSPRRTLCAVFSWNLVILRPTKLSAQFHQAFTTLGITSHIFYPSPIRSSALGSREEEARNVPGQASAVSKAS